MPAAYSWVVVWAAAVLVAQVVLPPVVVVSLEEVPPEAVWDALLEGLPVVSPLLSYSH